MRAGPVKIILTVAALGALGACETADPRPPYGTQPSISIPYDPYNYDPDELMAAAMAHCEAYGRHAVYVDETIDPNSVRWRYRHFDCV